MDQDRRQVNTRYYIKNGSYKCPKNVPFIGSKIPNIYFEMAEDFAERSLGNHRPTSHDTSDKRPLEKQKEDSLRGKLSELLLSYMINKTTEYLQCTEPDLKVYPLGTWDSFDLEITPKNGCKKIVSVKGTKNNSNFLLLTLGDYDDDMNYRYTNDKQPDIHFLVRTDLDKKLYDCPGFLLKEDLISARKRDFIMYKKERIKLGPMLITDNLYACADDLRRFEKLIQSGKSRRS